MVDQSLQGPFRTGEYDYFWFLITTKKLDLRSFLRAENYYDRQAKDAVYLKGPMMTKVPLYPRVTQMGRRYWFEPEKDLTDEIESTEEFENLMTWVKNPVGNPKSVRVLEDDPFLIAEMKESDLTDGFCVVTDDIRLCRQAYAETRRWVVRIPVKWYYMAVYYGDDPEPWIPIVESKWSHVKWRTLQDTGSIESYEEIGFRDGLPILWPAERPLRLTQSSFKGYKRLRAQRTFPDTESAEGDKTPYRFPENYFFGPNHFMKWKRHPFRRGWE